MLSHRNKRYRTTIDSNLNLILILIDVFLCTSFSNREKGETYTRNKLMVFDSGVTLNLKNKLNHILC